MRFLNHSNRLHHTLLYAAYGWLLLSGLLQIGASTLFPSIFAARVRPVPPPRFTTV